MSIEDGWNWLKIMLVPVMSDFVFCCLNLSYRRFRVVNFMASTIILIIKQHSVSFIKSNLLLLCREMIGVYSEDSTEDIGQNTLCDKMKSFKIVQHMVHIYTCGL